MSANYPCTPDPIADLHDCVDAKEVQGWFKLWQEDIVEAARSGDIDFFKRLGQLLEQIVP